MQDFVGKQIDRYHITERLGMGGMAVVYKAYDTRLERDVALKHIRTGSIPPDDYERLMKRFEREAKSQARFNHRQIIPVHDYGIFEGSPYLVMSYVRGGSLKQKMTGPVDWRQAVRWVIPIAEALFYAHKRGVIHRDVKPGNILFDEEGQPMLTDFGIAKILETDEATLTGTGMGVGTPEYMAPEQRRGEVCEASDQYALGVVLYELITGQKPYTADTPAAIILMQATEPLRAPSQIVRDVPEAVEKVLYKALAKAPGDRYEDMRVFKNSLEKLLDGQGIQEPEHVMKKLASAKSQPVPVVDSEGETRDAMEPTPMEVGIRKPVANQDDHKESSGKRFSTWLPKWALWVGAGVIGLGIIGLMIGIGGNLVSIGRAGEGPLGMLATATSTATRTPTKTATLTLTSTSTSTATSTPTITLTPILTLGMGSTLTNQKDGAAMVFVPEGEFLMGSEDGDSDESPEHTVTLDAYWIYKYEVTNAQYRQCIEEGVCSGSLSSYPEDNYPAVYIDWSEADTYCEWAGGRLPTEAEWEKAARGTDGRTYPWGEESPTCSLAQISGCPGDSVVVGSFPNGASPYGALDMDGNVWEWVTDWYDADYYATSPGSNPTGPGSGTYRVTRGGSWHLNGRYLRTSNRGGYNPDYTGGDLGFRCFRSPEP